MSQKNVLFIVYYFPPMGSSGVQRPLKFVKYLRDFGWNPIVLAPEPGMYHTFDPSLKDELDAMLVEVHRVNAKTPFHVLGKSGKQIDFIPPGLTTLIRKMLSVFYLPDNKTGWIRPALEKAGQIMASTRIDVIFSTAPPYSNQLIVADLKRRTGKPVVMDFRDDWLEYPVTGYATPVHRRRAAKIERECIRHADIITANNQATLESLKSRCINPETRFQLLPHGYDPQDFQGFSTPGSTGDIRLGPQEFPGFGLGIKPGSVQGESGVTNAGESAVRSWNFTGPSRRFFGQPDEMQSSSAAQEDSKLKFLYSGIFYGERQPDVFLNAVVQLLKKGVIAPKEIELGFQGGLDNAVKDKIRSLGLVEITTDYGFVPHDQAIKNLMAADIPWLLVGHTRNGHMITPGKLYEYIATGKPVLGLVPEGNARQTLQDYKAGFISDPFNTNQVIITLTEIVEKWRTGNLPKPDADFIKKHDRRAITQQLANLFDDLA